MENEKWRDYCISMIPQIKARHKKMLGRDCDLSNPKRFTDKLEWLKVYDSTFLKSACCDKLVVRDWVKYKLGKDISIPVIKTYSKPEDINFDELPNDYVLKTNHGSHTNIIVRNGSVNRINAVKQLKNWLAKDWTWYGYEMPYMLIERKCFAEQMMVNEGQEDLTDYKFLCFNGRPTYCQVINDRHNSRKRLNYYDMNWNPATRISRKDFPASYKVVDPCPATFNQMKLIAQALAADFKFVRVDLYEIGNTVYFGELTFYPGAAYIQYDDDDDTDFMLGKLLSL